jgi:hypothetical protein
MPKSKQIFTKKEESAAQRHHAISRHFPIPTDIRVINAEPYLYKNPIQAER